ncbi:MAG: protein-L-isoaspartate O-methyltransferase [Deltaproteobacteria bacterium RIFCSPLOWO2_02_FULL_50_16]|nr:MAG: protein-L-isoaspartate O-methyltransferase [Deltaproteobacteria bacterium GWA2_50_8]OGQ25726.1 MAG: protein-L-isoaspartate O-methyltransferase [Deltaproteobacteria bacterium RIFCSPHIGHO2_02_FULL_50_15]OGQ56989.1 MAG: protein-L-isoaspartate O-methyltransferase [Deltaproteobacteria bacterium RIFCSPLOWO2_02_FULL_50_16]OGQ68067.1 MAG: protein-L-isoaspartate O-methyltransferase [Deltaproteobacteria bacterium RIFCSPLOWO2_12_FULL_50_11]
MDYAVARRKMVHEQIKNRGIRDECVIKAMETVPRHLFVPPALVSQAYQDHPLNIGNRQTISQPFIVAYMTELLQIKEGDRVLEIGTGSGYQTAILYEMKARIFSMERIKEFSQIARKRLYSLGYDNFNLRVGDGTQGWAEEAPFDAIIVTAAAPSIPQPLIDQLKEGGRLVVPVGSGEIQELCLGTIEKGQFIKKVLTQCRFVKLLGEYGWESTR